MPSRSPEHHLSKENQAFILFLFILLQLLSTTPHAAEAQGSLPNSRVFQLSEHDFDGDGFFEITGRIQSGDRIVRNHDGVTQVEAGEYLVPDNLIYADRDGDGIFDTEALSARLVIVLEDNLSYLFDQNNYVLGVFPNGIGHEEAQSVPGVKIVDTFLNESWGQAESDRRGFGVNAFGLLTIATSFYVNDHERAFSAQEVHGTPPEWEWMLGTPISGGCVRHQNSAILHIARNIRANDLILSIPCAGASTRQTLYRQTLRHLGLPPASGQLPTLSREVETEQTSRILARGNAPELP